MKEKTNKSVGNIQRRGFDQLTWVNPKQVLINYRHLELNFLDSLDQKVRTLRTNKLKEWREARDAALFSYGMANEVLKTPVLVAKSEKSDYDFIMKWIIEEKEFYCPVQLKELPPDDINPNIQIENIFEKLKKYCGEHDLLVSIKINREIKSFDLNSFKNKENLKISELWYFGCLNPEQSKWFLYGSILESNPSQYDFAYPKGKQNYVLQ